ncbi:helix-turn-helix domain-containing protein [Shewanella ulleungensis]|uniref:Transcriptional regulator n=2 Tax=Shewanella ulleungensis TaxID=2282699 RepID=A0ABQ2QIA2_9GAMM|nr:XRE family transcriptional regulator [Shewanella ulleungensis]MCL1151093.1 XRE family transcriptional regulator [Shewanella ulleungensis]GGP82913.1 transcriptional regulator [Shewanella ulleungensis]
MTQIALAYMNIKAHMAKHLKALRTAKALSLDATAKLTGVSKAMLGQIERQESSPTIATLWKISSGLDTSFSAFMSSPHGDVIREKTFPDDPNMLIKNIFTFNTQTRFEMFEIILSGYHQQMSTPHSVGVIEHVIVLQGELALFSGGEWQTLTSGQSSRFFADQPHGYHALSETAIFQNIVSYPLSNKA